jgi:hypothetical protein
MSKTADERAGTRAEEAFISAERRDSASKQIIDAERVASAAKTKKLRALRLAKEAVEGPDNASAKMERRCTQGKR